MFFGTSNQIRTGDLRLERAMSWTARRWRHIQTFGWDGGNRTPIDGTRIRCPAVRRHPNLLIMHCSKCLRKQVQYSNIRTHASLNLKIVKVMEMMGNNSFKLLCI